MRRVDRSFDPQNFLNGAEAAFRLIVTEFAAGNRDALRPLLTDETFTTFEGVITARDAAAETQTSEIRDIQSATIEAATLTGTAAEITVRFVSDQMQPDPGPRRPARGRCGCGDRAAGRVELRARPGEQGSGLAVGERPLGLKLGRRMALR